MKIKIIILFFILIAKGLFAEQLNANPGLLEIQNEFLKIVVNNENYNTGRFAIETTKGNPKSNSDDFVPLIYGRPKPWTSYTTIRIEQIDYIFGGKTKKRAGKYGAYGKMINQFMTKDKIVTVCEFEGVVVTQNLSFQRNPVSNVKDSVLISYEINNTNLVSKNVGIRIMLDTMLGSNDGAPFRIGDTAITSEKGFIGSDILDYWQTFDSLVSPNVIAQGTLKMDGYERIVPPDRMFLVNWGTLADKPWTFVYKPNRKFIREGETEKDTALALYWNQVELGPNMKKKISTIYGLGGMTLSPGDLALGLACPREIYAGSKNSLLIVGYILNSGGYDSRNTKAKITLPQGLELLSGKTQYNLGTIATGEARQIALQVKVKGGFFGEKQIKLEISSETLKSNAIERNINLLKAPGLDLALKYEQEYVVSVNRYVPVNLKIKNQGKYDITHVYIKMNLKNNKKLPFFENYDKKFSLLKSGEMVTANWILKMPTANMDAYYGFSIDVKSDVTEKQALEGKIHILKKQAVLKIKPSRTNIAINDYFYVFLRLDNPDFYKKKKIYIVYESKKLKLIRYSPDPWIWKNISNNMKLEPGYITISNLDYNKTGINGRICKFHFKVLEKGNIEIRLEDDNKVLDRIQFFAKKGRK